MKIGVIGIIVEGNREAAMKVQELLSSYAHLIRGRMGVPDQKSGVNVIAVIVEGSNEEISALSGKLGRLESIKVKSALTDLN